MMHISSVQHAKCYAIIVAGGCGARLGTDIPKQFLLLGQKPLLMHSMAAFYHSELRPQIIVVLHADFHAYWEELCKEHQFSVPHQLVKGGAQRFHSVRNGLAFIPDSGIVAVHDAVRPLITNQVITNSFLQAEVYGSAVTAVPSKDSIRKVIGNKSVAINREAIYLVQTPQTFESNILKKAYQQAYCPQFTDDASVVEHDGVAINLIRGDEMNIKITFPQDLLLAEMYLSNNVAKYVAQDCQPIA